MNKATVITVDQARKTLGKKAESMTDDQIQTVLNSLTQFAEIVIDQIIRDTKGSVQKLKTDQK